MHFGKLRRNDFVDVVGMMMYRRGSTKESNGGQDSGHWRLAGWDICEGGSSGNLYLSEFVVIS